MRKLLVGMALFLAIIAAVVGIVIAGPKSRFQI